MPRLKEPPEEVAHHLGHPRPSVAIARWRAIPLKLAVLEERFYRVTAAVPVEIERQILVRSGDDCPISHFDDLPKVSAGALCPRLVARDLHAVPASCREESGLFTKAYKAVTCTSAMEGAFACAGFVQEDRALRRKAGFHARVAGLEAGQDT